MMEIRPAARHDRNALEILLRRRGTFNEAEIDVALELIDETLDRPEAKDYEVFCAFDGEGILMGYLCFGLIPMTEGCYDLYWIVVDERFSRKGVGRNLLEFMEVTVRGNGARTIYVETSSTAPYTVARALYEKCGYRIACVLEDFYRNGDHKIIFVKEVPGLALEKTDSAFAEEGLRGNRQGI